jgi:hypothetical protein
LAAVSSVFSIFSLRALAAFSLLGFGRGYAAAEHVLWFLFGICCKPAGSLLFSWHVLSVVHLLLLVLLAF